MKKKGSKAALPTIFKSSRLKWMIVLSIVVYPIIAAFLITAFIRSIHIWGSLSIGSRIGIMLLPILVLFFGIISLSSILGVSDISIDNQGISRRLFSKVWQTIPWGNVRLITAAPASASRSYSARVFHIYLLRKPPGSFFLSSMFFNDKFENASHMVKLINQHAKKHGIEIKIRSTMMGELIPTKRL